MNVQHQSSKDDRDHLLEYQSIKIDHLTKVNLFGVEFNNVNLDESVAIIYQFIESKKKFRQILFLDPIKLMYMRTGARLHYIAENVSLIISEGAGLKRLSKRFGNELKTRIHQIALMMDLIRLSELKNYSIFLLGGRDEQIEKIYFNLTRHFPKARIVGRHSGYMDSDRERLVKEAVRKTSPDIIFYSNNFPKQEEWIYKNSEFFGKAIVIGVGGAFDILSGSDNKAPNYIKLKGYTWLWRALTKPYKIKKMYYLFLFFLYYILYGFLKRK